jgi:hypothetical protein
MLPQRIENMFHFRYLKSSEEIITKMKTKVLALRNKIEDRKVRIKNLRTEYKITDAVYANLLEQARDAQKRNEAAKMSYVVKNDTPTRGMQEGEDLIIGAGVVNHLLTEQDFVKNEEAQADRLELICRNLRDTKNERGDIVGHELGEAELTYLGF